MAGGMDLASLGIEVRSDGVLVATKALKGLVNASKDAEKETKNLKNEAERSASSFRSMEKSLSLVSGVLKFEVFRRIAQEMYALGKNVYTANLEMQSISNTFKAATGSANLGAQEMKFLREESKRLGLDLMVAADSYRTLTAAARGTVLEGAQARNIFTAVAEASTVLGLSSQKTEMALYAVQQMISKGVVSMEELRRQLGDQIPGAFQIAARSMGLGEREFNKLVESGQLFTTEFLPFFVKAMREQFAGGVEDASQSARAELNKFNNAMLDLKLEIGEGGFFVAMTEALREFARTLDDPQMKENMKALGEFAGKIISGMAGVAKYANLRGRSGLQDQVTELFKSGEIGWGDKLRLDEKLGGFMGTGFKSGTTIGEKWEGMLEAQKEIDNIIKARDERQKESERLANPALLSREMEGVWKRAEEAGKRQQSQELKIQEDRLRGFNSWKRSIENIDDTQRAVNKLNDDYNAKLITGVSVLQKFGIAKEQAEALSLGKPIDTELLTTEQKMIVEQAQRQFVLAKELRDKDEAGIYAKEDRVTQKTISEANKRQKKINDVSQDLAKLTMSDLDRELLDVDVKFKETAAEIGGITPELVRWRDLQKELVAQNFADEMRDAMYGYRIQLKEAEVATSGIGAASLDVLTLQAEKAKELANIRKEYYRVGADNSFYEELTGLVEKQYALQIGAAEYAQSWEAVTSELEHVQKVTASLGKGQYAANKAVMQSQLDMVKGDTLLDPLIKARKETEIMAEMSRLELDRRIEIAQALSSAYSLSAENAAAAGDVGGSYENRINALAQEKAIAKESQAIADSYAEQAYYAQELARLTREIKELEAERSLNIGELAVMGVNDATLSAHQEMADFYKTSLPDALNTATSSFSEFTRNVIEGNASAGDAWKTLGNIVSDVVLDMLQELLRLQLQMAIMGMLKTISFSGFNVGGARGTSTGTGGGYNMGGGVVTGLHSGGIVGTDSTFMRAMDMSLFANAPRYHTGGIAGDEVPIIAKRGEGVFTEGQMKALGGASVEVNVYNSTGSQAAVKESKSPSGDIRFDVYIEDIVSRSITGRGKVGQSIQTAFNAKYKGA